MNKLYRQDPASDVEEAHQALARRVETLAFETDNLKLLALTLEGEFDILSTAAAQQLSDSTRLEDAAVRASDREVVKILLEKLNDKVTLHRIAAAANYPTLQLRRKQE